MKRKSRYCVNATGIRRYLVNKSENSILSFRDRDAIGFGLLEGLYYSYFGTFYCYITTYLLSCGMPDPVLSEMLSVNMFCTFFSALSWGRVCDRFQSNRKIFVLEFTAAVLLGCAVYLTAERSITVSAFIYPLFGMTLMPLSSNIDAWVLRSIDKDAQKFGKIRSSGPAFFAFSVLFQGILIRHFGYILLLVIPMAFAIAVLVLAFRLPEAPYRTEQAVPQYGFGKTLSELCETMKIREWRQMIVLSFFFGLAVMPINTLKTVLIQNVGGDVGVLGLDSFFGAILQGVFIYISGIADRLSSHIRLLLVSVCFLLTCGLTFSAASPILIIAGTTIYNIGYGIMLPTVRQINEKAIPAGQKNTAHFISDSVFTSFSGVVALAYSSWLMDHFPIKSVPAVSTVIMAGTTLFCLARKQRKLGIRV